MQSVLHNFALLSAVVELALCHGSMNHPSPRNNERNATHAGVKAMLQVLRTSSGIMERDFFYPSHDGTCDGPVRNATVTDGKCVKSSAQSSGIKTTTRPTNTGSNFIDCTAHNDCSLPTQAVAEKQDTSEVVWILYYSTSDCSGDPFQAFKMNLDACTSLESTTLRPTTPGCEGLSCLWFSQGCGIGCPKCTEDNTHMFTSPCNSTMQPTITDPKYRTINRYGDDPDDWTASHPWRAPGNAPVLDPCGMAGGSTKNNDGAGGFAPKPGHHMGDRGSQLSPSATTIWTAGSTATVAWGIWANHGGGYQYRLCPKSEPLTEECFQRTPLPFAGSTQKLRLGNKTELQINATLVSSGTLPEGSTWAMNPVPSCADTRGTSTCSVPEFPPPHGCGSYCWGYIGAGGGRTANDPVNPLPTIVDEVTIPKHLAEGEYVLGWRWDCEQSPQVWASCADVVIVKEDTTLV